MDRNIGSQPQSRCTRARNSFSDGKLVSVGKRPGASAPISAASRSCLKTNKDEPSAQLNSTRVVGRRAAGNLGGFCLPVRLRPKRLIFNSQFKPPNHFLG